MFTCFKRCLKTSANWHHVTMIISDPHLLFGKKRSVEIIQLSFGDARHAVFTVLSTSNLIKTHYCSYPQEGIQGFHRHLHHLHHD